jgi:twinkle protein
MNWKDKGIIVNESGSNQQVIKCPECADKRRKKGTRTLSVNLEKKVWNCHHCGWSGNLTTFKVLDNYKYKTKVKKVEKIYKKPVNTKISPITEKALKWFNSRGISSNTLKKCNVSSESAWMPQTNKNENCIVFNYFLNGEIINKKYRDGRKNMKLEKDARLIMYAPSLWDIYQQEEEIYITEGEPDALTLVELGFQNVLSTPNGAPPENVDIKEANLSYLQSLDEIAPKAKKFILAMDNDRVGRILRQEIARRIGIEKCYFIEYPNDCKDINDVLIKHGKSEAISRIKKENPFPISGKYDIADMSQSVYDLYDNGQSAGLRTGWIEVDSHYTVKTKQFTIVTGIPSHGKSSFLDNLFINMAKIHSWKFGIFSPENFPFEEHIAKFCELIVGKPFHKGYKGRMSKNELETALIWLDNHFFFLMPEKDDIEIDDILDLARISIFRNGINGLVIDPWNELEHNRGSMTETDYASKTLSKIRKFSRVNDIHTWIVAHPTKLQKDRKTGDYPVPTPYDIAGSAHFRNKADNCLCVHRDFSNNTTKLYIQKVRFKQIGKTGDVELVFDPKNNRYHVEN